MKKTLAIILALALVFSSFTAAFAEETLPADAKAVTSLGMLVGAGNGVTLDYLKTAPTRIQAAIMVLRLKGLEATAKAFTGTDNFADAKDAQWAAPIMAYLKANPTLGWIGDGTNFSPNKEMTTKDYYKVMLETLGYKQNTTEVIGDFTYTNVMDFAASKGLTKNAAILSFTVNDLAVATMETLKATVKGSTKTLGFSLVETKVLTEAAAVAAGVYVIPADKAAPKVASITMTDLKVATIKFDEKVDKTTAETAANYLPAGTPTLGDDGMTVTLNLTTALVNATDVEFTVKNVKDVLANKMEETKVTVKAFDTTIPVAEKIELTGPQQFKVTFSEPIDATASAGASILVDNGAYGATGTISGKVLTVNLGSVLTSGVYKVKLTGYKDYAGFAAVAKEFDLTYAKDTTPVTASIKKATQTYVVVEFNKAVKGDQLTTATFYHTFTAWQPKAVTQEDGTAITGTEYYKTVKVAFTDSDPATSDFPIPAGTTSLVVLKAVGTTTELVDQWGNKMASDATLALTITSDSIAPTVVKVEATKESEVVVTFSEDVTEDSAETVANYVIKDSEGKAITSSITPVYTNTDNVYKTTLTVSPALVGSNYTIEVKDVKDVSLAANKVAAVTLTLLVTDKTAATISSAVVVENLTAAVDGTYSDAYVYLTFNEAMATTGAGSVLEKANYQLDGKALPTAAKVELFGSTAKKVKVTLPGSATSLVSTTRLVVGQLADVAGNKISALSTAVAVVGDTAPTTIASVKTTDKNKVEIVINATLKTVTTDGIQVKKTSASTAYDVAAVTFTTSAPTTTYPQGRTTIIATLNAASAVDTVDQTPYSVAVVDNKLVTETGKKLASVTTFTGVVDGVGPSYASIADATAGDYRFEVTFNENLAEISSFLTATELVLVDKDGKTLTANVDYTTAISGKDLRVTLIGDYADAKYVGTKFVVSTKTTVTYFGDDLGANGFTIGTDNAAKAFSGKEVTLK